MPHIAMVRADIPEGVLQITDLKPNNSRKNNILEPAAGQTKYVKQPSTGDVATRNPTGSQFVTVGVTTGLAAYLIDNVEDQAAGAALTAAQANEAAGLIITNLLRAGVAATEAAVNSEIQSASGVSGSTTLTAGDSTGDIADVLQILAGRPYSVPDNAEVQNAAGDFQPLQAGAFDSDEPFVGTLSTGALNVSLGSGQLAGFSASTFEYEGTAGQAVIVYDDDGSILTV